MMVQIIPIIVRNSANGTLWFASDLTYGQMGRGYTPQEAMDDLNKDIAKILPGDTTEIRVRSVEVNFPTSKSVLEFFTWMENIQEKQTSAV